ncbi:MAG: glycine cleavage system aminomethyltransferase GcvT [Bacteriovoracaceae bacterium]
MTDLQKTHLYEQHRKLGAKIVPFAGWEMPVQYNNLKEEVLAVRNNVGMFDVSHMGEFWVTGKDAVTFVDHIVTNDIKNAELNKAIYSPLCRDDGTVVDDLIVYKLEAERILICVNASNIEKDWHWIKSQKKNFQCELNNASDHFSLIALQGPKSVEILKSAGLMKNDSEWVYYSAQEIAFKDEKIIIARTGYTGEDGFEIFSSHSMANNLWEKFLALGVTPCGLGARDVLRLEVCYPLYGHELNDQVTPLDAGLKWTVKFSKEDFIGKSALATYKPRFQLARLILEKAIPRQDYLVENSEGKVIGKVCSGTMSVVTSEGIALAHIETNLYPKDEIFNIVIRDKKYLAKLTKKAFVTGGHK